MVRAIDRTKQGLTETILAAQQDYVVQVKQQALPSLLIRKIVRYMWTYIKHDEPKRDAYRQLLSLGLVSRDFFVLVSEKLFTSISFDAIAQARSRKGDSFKICRSFKLDWSALKYIQCLDMSTLPLEFLVSTTPQPHLGLILANVERLVIDNLQQFSTIVKLLPVLNRLDVRHLYVTDNYGLLHHLTGLKTLRLGMIGHTPVMDEHPVNNALQQYLGAQINLTRLSVISHGNVVDLSAILSTKRNIKRLELHPYQIMPTIHPEVTHLTIDDSSFTWSNARFTVFTGAHPMLSHLSLTFHNMLPHLDISTLDYLPQLTTLKLTYTCTGCHSFLHSILKKLSSTSIRHLTILLPDQEIKDLSIGNIASLTKCKQHTFNLYRAYNDKPSLHKLFFIRSTTTTGHNDNSEDDIDDDDLDHLVE
eukprot:gene16967-20185_t